MKAAPWILAAFVALPAAAQPVRPVSSLDMERFAGTWYEVARLHDGSRADCASDVTAHYQPRPDGTLTVTMSCRSLQGRLLTDVGDAIPAARDARHASAWKVSYLPRWLQWLPLRQDDVRVVMLDPQYRYAVTSDPRGGRLRVLARNPTLPAEALGRIVDRLTAEGFPTWQLVLTRQSAVAREIGPDKAGPVTGRPHLIVQRSAARADA